MKHILTFTLNGELVQALTDDNETLLDFLRNDRNLTGTKKGCEEGECGACTVLIDDDPVTSCLILAREVEGKNVTTIEGLGKDGKLDPLQQAFIDKWALQCGYCTPGMIMSAKALLDHNPHPSEHEIRDAIAGNLCRCTGYAKIVEAIDSVAKEYGGGSDGKNIQ